MTQGDCLCNPPVPVARKLERTPTTPMTNWKNKLLAFLHDPPEKAYDYSPEHGKRRRASDALPLCSAKSRAGAEPAGAGPSGGASADQSILNRHLRLAGAEGDCPGVH